MNDISITVTVSADVLEAAVREAWARAFRASQYEREAGGYGYEAVRKAIAEYVQGQMSDTITAAIAEQARLQLRDVVTQVVADELRRAAKAQAKRMSTDGTLLDMERTR